MRETTLHLTRFKIILLVVTALLIGFAALYIYGRGEKITSLFMENLEQKLSEITGFEVRIGSVNGNIFRRIILHDINCRSGDYGISFETAGLDYSLLDIISGKKTLDKENEIFIRLSNGSLKLRNKVVILSDIDAIARLLQDKIILKSLNFKLFELLNSHAEGEIIAQQKTPRVNLLFEIKPFFEKDAKFFSQARITAKGPVDNLSLYGVIKNERGLEAFLSSYALLSEGVLNLGGKLNFKNPETGISNVVLMNTEINIKESGFDAVFIPDDGRVIISGDYSQWPLLTANIISDHIKISDLDFSNSTRISSKFIFKESNFLYAILDLNTEYTILNYYPLDELEASLWVDRDILRLIYLKAGDTISASGVLAVKPPRKIFLKLNLSDFDISYPFAVTGRKEEQVASGRLSGNIIIDGILDKLVTRANFEARSGHLGAVDYEKLLVNVRGLGRFLRVYDSRLVRRDSFLNLDGRIDMRKFGKENFLEDIKITGDNKTIIWEGWDISKTSGKDELTVSKGLNGGLKIGFKAQAGNNEAAYEVEKPRNELHLEYKMPDENGALQFKTKENEEFFGVMKKYKF